MTTPSPSYTKTGRGRDAVETGAPDPAEIVLAVDFDGTLVANDYPAMGEPDLEMIGLLKQLKAAGCRLILYTCRTGGLLLRALELCRAYELEFDVVNENLLENIQRYGDDSRKIFATFYIDDRALGYKREDVVDLLGRLLIEMRANPVVAMIDATEEKMNRARGEDG